MLSYASLNKCCGTNWFADGGVAVQVAELKMLKHVVEQISSAPLAECGRSFFPARIEGQKNLWVRLISICHILDLGFDPDSVIS